jgi:hypothetical protein
MKQEEIVLKFFIDNPGQAFTRQEINDLAMPGAPYTSVQRALTNLTDSGKIIKSNIRKLGNAGRNVTAWEMGGDDVIPEDLERYDGLTECKTYCNESQIMPAMVYYIEDQGLSIRAASRCVDLDTGGAVTATRAEMVWKNRKGASNDAPKPALSEGLPEPGWVRPCKLALYDAITALSRSNKPDKNGYRKELGILKEHAKASGIKADLLKSWYFEIRDEYKSKGGGVKWEE